MNPITLVIADDQMLTREGLKTILDLEEDMKVVGTASNGLEACGLAEKLRPDLVLMDIQMPVMDGIEALKRIKRSCPETAVLILTTFMEDDYIIEGLAGGASGYMLKDMDSDRMIALIRDAAHDQFVLPNAVAARLAARVNRVTETYENGQQSSLARMKLTEREKEMARLIVRGLNNREIAEALYIGEGTVRNYISNLYRKLDVADRAQAILLLQSII